MNGTHRAPILAGLRVVELSAFIAGPLCGATLAAMGAQVIRVDPLGGGLDVGRWPVVDGRSLYWAGLNQGKRSVTIDTRSQLGREQVRRLITAPGEGAGIVLTNLPVDGWNSYQSLAELRHDLIMVLITGHRSGKPAVDYTVNAAMGFPFITGPEEQVGPVNHVLPAWDVATGYLAATAVLAAERQRRSTGEGQLVEISLEDVALAVAGHLGFLAEAQLITQPRARFGNYLYGTFGRDFLTRDQRYVMIIALTPRHWRMLGQATGLTQGFADLAERLGADLENEGARWEARVQISDLIAPWVAERSLSAVREIFDAAGVLWGPYQTFKDVVADHLARPAQSPVVAEVAHPGLGPLVTTGSPVRFGGAAPLAPQPAPQLGQDTASVMREFGLDQ